MSLSVNKAPPRLGANVLGRAPLGGSAAERDRSAYTPTTLIGLPPLAEVAISRGGTQAVARGTDGIVWAWGDNQAGQLGIAAGATNPAIRASRRCG